MGYKEGGLGINGQGIVKPLEVIMRPKFLGLGYKNYNKTANVTALHETSDENKALSQLSEKRKTELTVKESRLAKLDMQIRECELNNEREKVVGLRKEKERLVMEVIGSALGQLNNDSHSGNLSLELLGDLFKYMKRKATSPEPLLHFLDIWEPLTPHAALQKILATKHVCSSRRMFVSYRK
nr:septin and tuftelin-interacting protein 1 homolog 1 [Tanacetum cinerariifolium]